MASGAPNTPAAHQAAGHAVQPNMETPQSLKNWWTGFKKRSKKEQSQAPVLEAPAGIFGVPLSVSIKYANVAISLTKDNGESFIYGYVPIVVAKCGVFLKEKATDVEGIFRLSGSAKRIKELQITFDSPDRYGKGLNWTGYTVHDAANILRRYLNQLPQPIVPLELYERFRDPLRSHQTQAVGDVEAQSQDVGDFDQERAIATYQQLITELPQLNRQLLLYILDLLAVFASKSDINLMTSANLAAIFQPGLLSHPDHDMKPQEYRLSQDVLIFLVDNQDNFLIGMSGTAADEQTVREVQSGVQSRQPSTPTAVLSPAGPDRSASNASAGADSLLKYAPLRRNASDSSKASKRDSTHVPSPISPSSGTAFASSNTGNGVYRSNTVPSKKSPGLPQTRFRGGVDSPGTPGPPSPGLLTPSSARAPSPGSRLALVSEQNTSLSSSTTPTVEHQMVLAPGGESTIRDHGTERLSNDVSTAQATSAEGDPRPVLNQKGRKMSNLPAKSSTVDGDSKEARQPKKLQKKRMPSSADQSAHSSTHSLQNPDSPARSAFHTPMPTPGFGTVNETDPLAQSPPLFSNTTATPQSENGPVFENCATDQSSALRPEHLQHPSGDTLKPAKSPAGSLQSKSSVTDQSDAGHVGNGETTPEPAEKKRRWRFSSSAKKNSQTAGLAVDSSAQLGSNAIAETSTSSVGSWSKPRQSITNDASPHLHDHSTNSLLPSSRAMPGSNQDLGAQKEKDPVQETSEKKGPIGWLKAKRAQAKEGKKEREAEKERGKSPPPNGPEHGAGKNSLFAAAQDLGHLRGRSMEVSPTEPETQPHTVESPDAGTATS